MLSSLRSESWFGIALLFDEARVGYLAVLQKTLLPIVTISPELPVFGTSDPNSNQCRYHALQDRGRLG